MKPLRASLPGSGGQNPPPLLRRHIPVPLARRDDHHHHHHQHHAAAPISQLQLRQDMQRRPAKAIYDVLSPTPSHLLNISLSDYLPASCAAPNFTISPLSSSPSPPGLPSTTAAPPPMPQGHHMAYFPPQIPPAALLPDGTDPDHSPGPPFARRMWAGGSLRFAPRWREAMVLDGRRAVCVEGVGAVGVKEGRRPGDEKVFVEVCRRYGAVPPDGSSSSSSGSGSREVEESVRENPAIEERRNLVFMREKSPEQVREDVRRASARPVRVPHKTSFSIHLTPRPTLLFHFSALTFNAHAIHLDPSYCRDREGHRGLLVHGPLSLVLMLSALRSQLRGSGGGGGGGGKTTGSEAEEEEVRYIEYRNVAPLYAGEQLGVHVRPRDEGGSPDGIGDRNAAAAGEEEAGRRWDAWVEGPQGGLAVKGIAVTSRIAT